jgi:peptidoglycan hydrolase CwlO-like protein
MITIVPTTPEQFDRLMAYLERCEQRVQEEAHERNALIAATAEKFWNAMAELKEHPLSSEAAAPAAASPAAPTADDPKPPPAAPEFADAKPETSFRY